MRLMLIRHGETDNNAGGLVQGRLDLPLNALGQQQASAMGAFLSGEPLVHVACSPLLRARRTAEAVAAPHGLAPEIIPDLAEMDVGEMEGLSGPQMRERFPDFLAAWAGPSGPSLSMPGGESLEDVQARAWAVVERLREAWPEGTVAAVTHNFVLATVVCKALGLPLADFRRFRHSVAGRTVIDLRPDRTLIISLNDTCHLDTNGLLSTGAWERR
jgi:broad specificity phosphatase PhoE